MTKISRRIPRTLAAALLGLGALAVTASAAQSGGARVAAVAPKLAYVTGNGNPYYSWVRPLAGGRARKVGNGGAVLLAPNGSQVAVTSFASAGVGLHIVSTADGASRGYYDLKRVLPSALSWSVDSRYLAVDASPVSGTGGGRLDVIDTRTGSDTTIKKGTVCGASFSDTSFDELVFSIARGLCLESPSDLYQSSVTGSSYRTTTDGRSVYPVWGADGIAYDRFTSRGSQSAPSMQIFFMQYRHSGSRQVTHLKVPALLDGLQPLAFSADGKRLLAQLVGEDTESAYAVTMASGSAKELLDQRLPVQAFGISRDGRTLLVDSGAFENSPDMGRLETMPFGGGSPHVLVRKSPGGSWNR